VTVNLFDVDYWSENGHSDGLHKFGFSSTRRSEKGVCTHEVVMLSGRLRTELSATAAHEYMHLWINENCPASHKIQSDTLEGICELIAYKLMDSQGQTNQMEQILANPYTHGEIKKLVALEQERGMASILKWVKEGTTATLDTDSITQRAAVMVAARSAPMAVTNVPVLLPQSLRLGGLMLNGLDRHAIICGITFTNGETKAVPLRNRAVQVNCLEILSDAVILKVAGLSDPILLKIGQERFVP
jgi:hypothetical protein